MENTVQANVQQAQNAVALRGLAARIGWACAGVFADADQRYLAEGGARMSANLLGREDFARGRDKTEVPPVFVEVPDLTEAWTEGWCAGADKSAQITR